MDYDSFSKEELLKKYHESPSIELRNEIYKRYANIAQAVARKYVGRGIEYEDILQVARMSLLKSIERFDIDRGVKLQSFATPTIIGEIKNYFRAFGNSVKISRRSLADITKIKLAINELSVNLGRLPTVLEIGESVQMDEEYVLEMLDVIENSNSTSLDTIYSNENAYTLGDLVGNFDRGYDEVDIKDSIARALDVLSEREKYIIVQRYYRNKSQREVADTLEVSQMYISRAERKIFEKLRHRI
ncbi:MAG: sigma-70 family RNA polymerase sigma factor [Eubacteriales bacterium]